jgi:transcriptional regulator with XRE-family HTH domain
VLLPAAGACAGPARMIARIPRLVDYPRGNGRRTRIAYRGGVMSSARPVGDLLRDWRQRRRLSQLDLSLEAEISTRHLSFLETGRSAPSRDMVLRLAERLEVPLRERNRLLTAAGYAPVFPERPLSDPALRGAREAIDLVLKGHEPYPALAIDRHWTLVAANGAVAPLLAGAAAALLSPPVNVLRLSLHPEGLARHQVDIAADPVLAELLVELSAYPAPKGEGRTKAAAQGDYAGVVVPLQLATDAGILAFFSTTTIFGTPVDVTLSELAIEAFFPADPATAETLRRLAGADPPKA